MKEIIFAHDIAPEKAVECIISAGAVSYAADAAGLSCGEDISFTLTDIPDEGILEIEELHRKAQGVFAYSVSCCDNTGEEMLYFRSYEPCADAPNGFFIRLPDKCGKEAEITIHIEHGTVFLHSARVYSLSDIKTDEAMLAGFFTPPYRAAEPEITVKAVEQLCSAVTPQSRMKPMVSFEIPYMNRSDREVKMQFSYWLDTAVKTDTPLFVNLNSWWGGTPGGPDGKGGFFGDAEYQQVCFDPATLNYSLSVPNMWSNTPWLTMNHPVLNNARKQRLARVIRILQQTVAEYSAVQRVPEISVFLDNEPAYWAAFAYGGDPDAGGDFSPFLTADAKKDGVEFARNEPLGEAQREWLLKNMSGYINSLARVCSEQRGHEPIILKSGREVPVAHRISSNVYTHVFPFACYPYMHPQHPQWETHITPYAKLGIESSTAEDSRILDYAVRLGTFADINAERACMHDYDFYLQNYIYGADACMIFNYRGGDAEAVNEQGMGFENAKIPERDFPIPVVTLDIFNERMDNPAIVSSENMGVFGYRNRRVLRPESLGTGKMLIKAGKASDYGDNITVELWAFSHSSTGCISLSVGKTPRADKRSVYVPEHGNEGSPVTVDISLKGFDADDTVWLLAEIRADTFDADWCMLNYIWYMRLMRRHPVSSGHANGFRFSAAELRALNRAAAKRADERKSISTVKSDTYYIADRGCVGELQTECVTDSPIFICIENTENGMILSAEGTPGCGFRLEKAAAEPIGHNKWRVSRAGSEAELNIEKKPLPEITHGRYSGIQDGFIKITNHNCDKRGWQPYEELPLLNKTVFRLRYNGGDFEETEPQKIPPGADICVVCSEEGALRADATVNIAEGTVTEYTPVRLYPELKDATVTVKTEQGILSFSIGRGCRLSYPDAIHQSISGCPAGDPKIPQGQKVAVRFSSSGFENILPRALEIY